ncbi:MAG: Ig-like domain-containing protein [Burkholderiaceae bacterium]
MTDTGTVSITITPVNDNDPTANDDIITVAEGAPPRCLIQRLHLSHNDTDADLPNDSLTAAAGAGPTFASLHAQH